MRSVRIALFECCSTCRACAKCVIRIVFYLDHASYPLRRFERRRAGGGEAKRCGDEDFIRAYEKRKVHANRKLFSPLFLNSFVSALPLLRALLFALVLLRHRLAKKLMCLDKHTLSMKIAFSNLLAVGATRGFLVDVPLRVSHMAHLNVIPLQ